MGVKAEISWKVRDADGSRREINVRRQGSRWVFFHRERRFENWMPLGAPALEDWMALLDAVERRIQRRLLKPEEAGRVREMIRERYPEAELP